VRRIVVCLTVLFLLGIIAAPAALADPVVDPGFNSGGSPCQFPRDTILNTNVFPQLNFNSSDPSKNIFNFCNETGHTLTNLDFTVNTGTTHIDHTQVDCTTGDVFSKCVVTNLSGNLLDVFISGPPGVPDFHHCSEEGDDNSQGDEDDDEGCGHLFINMNCPAGATSCGPWPDGTTAQGVANVPEPMSAFLLGSGVLVVIRRRYGKRS